MTTALSLRGITVSYPVAFSTQKVHAVRGLDLDLAEGETVALVGESGCGKSSLARAALMLRPPEGGSIELVPRGDQNPLRLEKLGPSQLRAARRHLQVVFQDPFSTLNPRHTIATAVGEPLRAHGLHRGRKRRRAEVLRLLAQVGLEERLAELYPHELSGGQRQRVGLARALATSPSVLILDEAVSALDVSLRAQVINLLLDLKHDAQLSMLFITHDLSVVASLADRVAVMYLGEVVELGSAHQVLTTPQHPYTRALMAAVPSIHPPKESTSDGRSSEAVPFQATLHGDPPSPSLVLPGCSFAGRCNLAEPACLESSPKLRSNSVGTHCACHLVT